MKIKTMFHVSVLFSVVWAFSIPSSFAQQLLPGPKIEEDWLWVIISTGGFGGAEAAAKEIDYLRFASNGAMSETQISTDGAFISDRVGGKAWTLGKLATGCNNIQDMVTSTGLGEGDINNHVAYGSLRFESPEEQKTTMYVGSDDAVKVWLNGELIYNNIIDRGDCDYQDIFFVTLKEGINVLLVAVYEGRGEWSGFFGFEQSVTYTRLPPRGLRVDVNEDGTVNAIDLLWVAIALYYDYGNSQNKRPDVNTDGTVNVEDLLLVIEYLDDPVNALSPGTEKVTTISTPKDTPSTSETSKTTVNLAPSPVQSPAIGQQLTLSLNIAGGENVVGYQATAQFNPTTLRFVESSNGDYLSANAFFIPPVVNGNTVTIAGTSLAGESNGDGTLATLTFQVADTETSTLTLSEVILIDKAGIKSYPKVESAEITQPTYLPTDVNKDGTVNIQDLVMIASNFGKTGENAADVNIDGVVDIVDLVLVAAALGDTAAAPSLWSLDPRTTPTRAEVHHWLLEAEQLYLTDTITQRGILFLKQLLASLTPKETVLLPNYPNPFNPETWIPYQLADSDDVSITIYDATGIVVRRLALGHQPVGIYQSRSRAAYWNGRNTLGEPVASGVYFYTLISGDFSATRKMLIRK